MLDIVFKCELAKMHQMLAEVLDDQFTPEAQEAWSTAHQIIKASSFFVMK